MYVESVLKIQVVKNVLNLTHVGAVACMERMGCWMYCEKCVRLYEHKDGAMVSKYCHTYSMSQRNWSDEVSAMEALDYPRMKVYKEHDSAGNIVYVVYRMPVKGPKSGFYELTYSLDDES